MKYIVSLSILFFFSTPAQAAQSLNMGSAFLQMMWALLVVIGIILIIFGLAKKRFGLGRMQQGNINVLELRHIMPKTTLALVEVRGRVMLLGITAGQINLLADYPDSTSEKPSFDTVLAEQL